MVSCTYQAPGRAGRRARRREALPRVFCVVKSVIETAGGAMADVTFNHIFLTDWAHYAAIDRVRGILPGDKPARRRIAVAS